MRHTFLAFTVLLIAAGCAPAPVSGTSAAESTRATPPAPPASIADAAAPPTPEPTAPAAQLALSGEGLTFVTDAGSSRHVEFGVPASVAIEAATRTLGAPPETGRNEECGAGPLDMATWPNGLTLASQEARFVGWSLAPPPEAAAGASRPTTLSGIGLGSTRRELESAYSAQVAESTLGTEFQAGGLFGVLDGPGPDARIDALWAGTGCVFR